MSCGDRLFSFGKYLCLVNDLFCGRQDLALHIVFVPVIFNIIRVIGDYFLKTPGLNPRVDSWIG